MVVNFTDEASAYIRERHFSDKETGIIKLVYDTEGCGCAVNGVAAIWIVSALEKGDVSADSNSFDVAVDSRQQLFFEERLVVDFRGESRSLVLKSSQQIYNPAMKITDLRGKQ